MTATDRATELIEAAAQAAADKLAHDIIAYDVSDVLAITDAFLLASAPNDRQVKAIVEGIEETLNKELGAKPVRREGEREGRWVLIDYGDIVVHVQHDEERDFYELERLWKDCPSIPFTDAALAAAGRSQPATEDVTLDGVTDDVAPGDEAGDVVSGGVSGEGESAEAALDPATAHAPEADTTR